MNEQHLQNYLGNAQSYDVEGVQRLDFLRNSSANHAIYNKSFNGRREVDGFEIKTESDDKPVWNGQRDFSSNENVINSEFENSPNQTNQAHQNAQMDVYNNALFYQNNFQSVFPLDFYGRRHQTLADTFLSAYSNVNPANLAVQQYLQQCSPHQVVNTLKESNSNGGPPCSKRGEGPLAAEGAPRPTLAREDSTRTRRTCGERVDATRGTPGVESELERRDFELANEPEPAERSGRRGDRRDVPKSENEPKGRYSCESCPYACQSPAILKIHERVHSGEKPFACSFCDYKSGQKNNVAKHVLVHMKEKPYKCQYCDYRCAQKNNLIVHERTHTGVKPFACTFCEYKTVQKPNLVKHMYLHTNEKPFACDVCDYRCVQKTNLTKHKQKHTLEKPFECSDCDYRSAQKSNLNKHQLVHAKDGRGRTKRDSLKRESCDVDADPISTYDDRPDGLHYGQITIDCIKIENTGANF